MRLLRDLRPEAHITSLHLLLETVATNAQGLRDLLVEQLDNPGLFKAGWYGADGHSAGLAIASAMPWLRSEEHTSELQSLMRISYAVFCLSKKKGDWRERAHTYGRMQLMRDS